LRALVPILRFAFSSVKVVRHIEQILSVENIGGDCCGEETLSIQRQWLWELISSGSAAWDLL